MRDLEKIRRLVGDITADDLKYVDCYVTDELGIFIPSIGYCNYAITPNHTHPSYMFNIFTAPEHNIVKQELKVPKNSYFAVAMSPDIPHTEEQGDSYKHYYAIVISKELFNGEYFSYGEAELPLYSWKQFIVGSEIIFYIKQFIHEYENDSQKKILESLAFLITHKIIADLLKTEFSFEPVSSNYEIEKAEQYIYRNYGNKLTISCLAELLNMSVSHFIRTFEKETNIPPMKYILKVRIEKAKKFLKCSDKTVTEVALICGFGSASHFSSYFFKQTGLTPTDYRKIYIKQNYENKK